MSVGALVDLLRGFQTSGAPREQQVFACMVHSLFDEYRFFHNYPDKELHTTGEAAPCLPACLPGPPEGAHGRRVGWGASLSQWH